MDMRAILAGLAFALIWSSAFTSARIIVTDAPPILALSLRFLISGMVGIAIARMLGQTWRLTPAQWKATIVFGICQNALYLGLNFVAMQSIEASLASIIASTMPLAVGFAGWVILCRTSVLGRDFGTFCRRIGCCLDYGRSHAGRSGSFWNHSLLHSGGLPHGGDIDGPGRILGWKSFDDHWSANARGFCIARDPRAALGA